jgi:hypothetical protein
VGLLDVVIEVNSWLENFQFLESYVENGSSRAHTTMSSLASVEL